MESGENITPDKYTAVHKLTDNPYLNLYHMNALTDQGAPFSYYFASRNQEEELPLRTKQIKENGIVIYPVWQEDPGKIVLIRQYRYPLDAWIYELPAGLVDQGETPEVAAVREMREETGLTLQVYTGGDPAYRRPYFLGAGITDETSTSVYGLASGHISEKHQEESESIRVVLADKEEVRRILKEEKISLRAAFLLMHFLQSLPEDPFAFLN